MATCDPLMHRKMAERINLRAMFPDWQGSIDIRQEAADPNTLKINIHGVIGFDFWGEGITSKSLADQLDGFKGNLIEVSINSPGGSAFDGIAIFNMLKRHPAEVMVHVDGLAASAASIIAMAGDVVSIGDGAMVMIHNPATFVWGESKDMRKTAETLESLAAACVSAYANHCKLAAEEIAAMMDRETWMGADEAVERGFATEKFSGKETPALATILCMYNNTPASLAMLAMASSVAPEKDASTPEAEPESTMPESPREPEAPAVSDREQLAMYIDEFGADGARMFLDGKTLDECRKMQIETMREYIASLRQENESLNDRLKSAQGISGELQPVSAGGNYDDGDNGPTRGGFHSRIRIAKSSRN